MSEMNDMRLCAKINEKMILGLEKSYFDVAIEVVQECSRMYGFNADEALNKMELKRKAFLETYKKTYGNISVSCKTIGISRGTYYWWIKDEEFKKEIDSIEPDEEFVDFAEFALLNKIKDGDTTAIIFTLKTKGKKRGYVETQKIEQTNIEQPLFNLNVKGNDSDK